jgi:hypothetical protein
MKVITVTGASCETTPALSPLSVDYWKHIGERPVCQLNSSAMLSPARLSDNGFGGWGFERV